MPSRLLSTVAPDWWNTSGTRLNLNPSNPGAGIADAHSDAAKASQLTGTLTGRPSCVPGCSRTSFHKPRLSWLRHYREADIVCVASVSIDVVQLDGILIASTCAAKVGANDGG